MRLLRSVLLRHPLLGLVVGLAGLLLRLAVPAGFMPMLDHGRPALTLCSDDGTAAGGGSHHDEGKPSAGKSCAFADLSFSLIGGSGPVQPAAAPFFAAAAAPSPGAEPATRAALRLRPPLRGPPLPA